MKNLSEYINESNIIKSKLNRFFDKIKNKSTELSRLFKPIKSEKDLNYDDDELDDLVDYIENDPEFDSIENQINNIEGQYSVLDTFDVNNPTLYDIFRVYVTFGLGGTNDFDAKGFKKFLSNNPISIIKKLL